jgi:diadenylate cyclase
MWNSGADGIEKTITMDHTWQLLAVNLRDIRILDVVDVVIVLFLLYQLYKLLKGTIAFNIFIGVLLLYVIWLVVSALDMNLLTFILGPFVGFGVLIVIIIFQQEVRQFLLMLGNNTLKNRFTFLQKIWGDQLMMDDSGLMRSVDEVLFAMTYFSESKTGALIVFSNNPDIAIWNNSGQIVDSRISSQLLKSIFQKESPMHDGAVVLVNNRIYSASVILPISESKSLPVQIGLRHRAAIGVSEKTNATAFVVSEERGDWSMATKGILVQIKTQEELKKQLKLNFIKS